ncbi:DUF1570 domain-containing protein [Tsuneonella sp. HG094]
MKIRGIATLIIAWCATPAAAEWHKAESEHFVIYADDGEKDIRKFAEMLERYRSAMEFATGFKYPKPSPSNRVTVYAVGDAKDVQSLAGTTSRFLQGFYVPRAGASVAFVPDMRSTRGEPDPAMSTLMHEYSHHFLLSASRSPMPRWVSEGAAEFYSSATFMDNGGVQIGKPNQSRGYELFNADSLTIEELLDEAEYAKRKSRRYDSFYGQSWLLYHYLMFVPERTGQIGKYLREFAAGKPPLDAARAAFGDLSVLSTDLQKYLRQRRMMMIVAKPERISTGPVTVTRLSVGHSKMMPAIIRSRRGVDEETAKEVLALARTSAQPFATDAEVQAALAEAEFDVGNDAEAVAAADRAIAANPGVANAYVQKGFALFRQAEDSDDRAGAYKRAMAPFTALNGIEADHPMPLIHYYRVFQMQGVAPPESARHALERASQLAPFDLGLSFEAGLMLAGEGKIELARTFLQPVAAAAHGGSLANQAKAAIAVLSDKSEGTQIDVASLVVPTEDIEAASGAEPQTPAP